MSVPRGVSVLVGASPTWVRVNRPPNTKSHTAFGNKYCDAGKREVSGYNASECIEPRNSSNVRGLYCS
jgi:hypothetical protein